LGFGARIHNEATQRGGKPDGPGLDVSVPSSPQRHLSHRASRYRTEGDLSCIDVRVGNVLQLFDNRDPAPFLVRELMQPDKDEAAACPGSAVSQDRTEAGSLRPGARS
jgi:hypothetical protein